LRCWFWNNNLRQLNPYQHMIYILTHSIVSNPVQIYMVMLLWSISMNWSTNCGWLRVVPSFQAALRQLWSLALTRVVPSFDRLVGVSLIVISVSCTMYIGPDKEMEWYRFQRCSCQLIWRYNHFLYSTCLYKL